MRIDYQDLTIRNAETADAAQLTAWWNDGAVMAHAGFPNGLGTTAEEVAGQILSDSDEMHRRLIIERDGTAIGEMGYRNTGSKTAEIGIKICETAQQNQGIGKILLSMLISSLFAMGFQKIILDTNLKNRRAQHVYEQLGFRKLRVNVNAWMDQLGEPQSSVDYELFPELFQTFMK